MRPWLLFTLAACGRIGFDVPAGDAHAFTHSTLTLAAPAGMLTDFPLLVVLDDTRAARDRIGDGSDLRFYDATGTVLPHEIEQLGAPGGPPLLAWVRVPVIVGAATTIEIGYGGDTGPDSTDPVWTSDYAAVWHFASDGTAVDSSMNHRDATAFGTRAIAGKIGSGRDFDGTLQEYLLVGGSPFAAAQQTVSGWLWARAITGGFSGVLTRQFGTGGDNDVYLGIVGGAAVATCESGVTEYDATGGTVPAQQFVHITGVATASIETLYLNGQQVGSIPVPGPLVDDTHPMFIGADQSNNVGSAMTPCCDYVDGVVDELRLENVARPPAWVDYDQRAQLDQVITYGPLVAAP